MPFNIVLTNQVSLSWDKLNSYFLNENEYESKYDLTYLKNYKKECLKQKKEKSCLKLISLFLKAMKQNKSFNYSQIACNLDNGVGCLISGIIELRRMRYTSAKYFFEKSCQLQNGDGCYYLGRRFSETSGEKYLHRGCQLKIRRQLFRARPEDC